VKAFNSSLTTIFSQPIKITLLTLAPQRIENQFFCKHVAPGYGNCLCSFKRTTALFKEVMGFVTTYPCNNSTGLP